MTKTLPQSVLPETWTLYSPEAVKAALAWLPGAFPTGTGPDGPLPVHYEPQESPFRNPLYRQQQNPTRQLFRRPQNPYNPTGEYEGSSRETIEAFRRVLDRARIPATIRLTRGRDIAAACGQLAAQTA